MHKNIMVQGTASSVGKSLITAGLCRIFYQDKYKICPFKSQNMALNSFITEEGLEMGRAQVVQAEASGIKARVFMNPILLKPSSDKKSQVIVEGRVYENMNAVDYFKFKGKLKENIKKSYNYIRKNFDISVIEGAGSPAEINLKTDDIVNMGMAKMAKAPVILVGDIDRGGVFASLVGTLQLLDDDEKELVKGVIINKFRGDIKILEPGIKMLEDIIKIPVLGIIPYSDINIEDEDSLSNKFKMKKRNKINISIINLNHLSNFTDFDALNLYDDIAVNFVTNAEELGDEDVIIIPGSKTTLLDLKILKENGMEEKIIRLARKGINIVGICGGYQMLGLRIKDELNLESKIKEINGFGLLELETEMDNEKFTKQVKSIVINKGIELEAYEIHQGRTFGVDLEKYAYIKSKYGINSVLKGNVLGTYLHGIFDNSEFTNNYFNLIREKKGLKKIEKTLSFKEFKEGEYNKLADLLRENLDMKKIYEIMEAGID